MKIFKDKNLTQELKILDFGIVPAGESKTFTFYVLNNSNAYIRNLNFEVNHKELKIIKFPTELFAQTIGELILEWNPSVTLKEGLKTNIKIVGQELWG